MADQVDKQDKKKVVVRRAVQKIASTEAGILFFRYLKELCHFEYTTLAGDPQAHEVNTIASIGREFERKIYLGVRQAFTEEQKFKIEVQQDNTKQDEEKNDGSS